MSGSFPPDTSARPAQGAPPRFLPADTTLIVAGADTFATGGCVSPMRDPRTGTVVHFERALGDRGDYAVQQGTSTYGLAADELLRLTCNTGHVIGVVSR